MGSTFSNISVLKSETLTAYKLKKFIISHMKAEGVIPSDIDSNGSKKIIIRNNPESKWFTIYRDDEDYKFLDNFSILLSKTFNTYSMSIVNMDSDFMIIQLSYGGKKKDTVIVGEPYDDMLDFSVGKAHGSIDAWKTVARDPKNLIEAFRENYICSEDVLVALQKEAGISSDDVSIHFEYAKNSLNDTALYTSSESAYSDFIIKGDTVIELYDSFGWKPIKEINKPCRYCFINRGGISKGAAVIISGSFINNSDTLIEEVHIQRGKNMDSEFFLGDNIMLLRMKTERGLHKENSELCFTAVFPDFEFPEGVSKNCRTLNGSNIQITERRHLISVQFLPQGSSETDLSDMVVQLQPLYR